MNSSISRRDFLMRSSAGAAACLELLTTRSATLARPVPAGEFRGIFGILQTPFHENDDIDWDSLEREVLFCVRAGIQGLAWPQLAAEFYLLSQEERRQGAEVILRAAGHTPVVIGVQAPTRELALRFAQHAEGHGASAVIALPPFLGAVGLETAATYYRTLAQGVKLPVFIQNSGPPWGPALPTELVIKLARENPQLAYTKEEVAPVGRRISEYARSGVMKGIFTGSSGRNLLDELAHGAQGTMPACGFPDIYVQIYDLAAQGKSAEAHALFEKLVPIINIEGLFGVACMKEVLVRRGVFKSAKMRGITGGGMDDLDRQELEIYWKDLAPHMMSNS